MLLQKWVEPEEVADLEVIGEPGFDDLVSFDLDPDSTYILPEQMRVVSSQTVDGLPNGKYKAKIEVYYGGKQPATMEKEFNIKKTAEITD